MFIERYLTIKEKLKSSEVKKIAANIRWLFIDKILRMGVGIIVGVWIARYLGPEQYGMLNYAQAFVAIFASVAGLGLDGIAVREIVKAPNEKNEILGTSFILKIVGAFVAIVFTMISINIISINKDITKYIIIITALGTIFQAFDTVDFWFQADVRSKYTVYAKNGAFFLATVIKIILVVTNAQLIAFAWVGLIEIIFGACGMLIAYKLLDLDVKKWCFSVKRSKNLLKDSWPLVISSLVIMLYMRIDQIMIGQILGDKAVGIYSVAVRITEIWYFIPMCIASSIYPKFIDMRRKNNSSYNERLQFYYNSQTWIAIFMASITYFIADWLILLLWGDKYIEAGDILVINIWTAVFVFQGVARSLWSRIENLQRYDFIFTVIGCLLNIVLNYFLIPIYQAKGAAFATLISQGFTVIVAPCFFVKTRLATKMLLKSFVFLQK